MNRRLLDSIKHRPLVIAEGSFLKYAITRSIVSLNGDESKIAKSPYLQPLCDSENDSFKFHPPMLLEKQNYKYLKPFSIAQKLQTRKAVLLPGSIDEPNADNARSRLPRGYFLVPKGLFCAVPLGCFNFSVDNQFPDENSLKNWLEIMERAMESASLHYEQVSLALIGMAKIQIATDGQFAQKIGWPLLVRWFSYVYEKLAQEKRTRKFLTVYDNMCRSAYRFIMNGVPRQVKPEDYAEIKRLTCDLLPRYCDYGLERLCATHGMVLTDDEADQRRVYILEKMVSVLWQVEFAFQPTSSLLDDEVSAQMSKNILEVAPHWIRNMGYGSKSLSDYDAGFGGTESKNDPKLWLPICLFSIRSAYMIERWNSGDSNFWRHFFRNPSETFKKYIEVGSERLACYYVILAVRILLRGRNMNSSDENGTHENFLRDVLEPFVKTYFPTSVHMPHSCEIERLDDVINNYDVNAGRFMTDDDLKWLKKCVDSYKPPMIVRSEDF